MILRNLFKEKGVRVSECLYTLGLHPVFEGDKGDRRVTVFSHCSRAHREFGVTKPVSPCRPVGQQNPSHL